jgi:hypothetical protein
VLAVTVQGDDERRAAPPRRRDAREQGLRLPQPARVAQDLGARRECDLVAAVARAVVDDQHRPVRASHRDDAADRRRLLEHRDHDHHRHAFSTLVQELWFAALTQTATCPPPRARPWTRPPPATRAGVPPSPATSTPERDVHAAAATCSTPRPAW